MCGSSMKRVIRPTKEVQMSDGAKRDGDKPDAGEQQSGAAAEATKRDDARAKDTLKAGNILGGVQPK